MSNPISRPILFSGAMVRAILEGRKTQTRRIVKRSITNHHSLERDDSGIYWVEAEDGDHHKVTDWCPYGQAGDRLWVRETWAHVPITAYRCSEGVQQTANPNDPDMAAVYAAGWDRSRPGRWKPSIHMPRWASRITLEVTGVRVERLQEISEADAKAEGLTQRGHSWEITLATAPKTGERICCAVDDPRVAYKALWESINGPGSWNANPWVWVVEFGVLE